jgi:hypothetical protein
MSGIHYVAFTKIPTGYSRPLGFSSLRNTVPLPIGRVTNKSNTKEPQHPASTEQVLCPDPIDGTTTKPTKPQLPLINHLRVSHTTLMVVLFSGVVIQRIGPYEEVLSHPDLRGPNPSVNHMCVRIKSHTYDGNGTEMNVTSLIYNRVMYKIVK